MRFFVIIILFFILSCTKNSVNKEYSFSNKMSLSKFKTELYDYAINSPYPKLND